MRRGGHPQQQQGGCGPRGGRLAAVARRGSAAGEGQRDEGGKRGTRGGEGRRPSGVGPGQVGGRLALSWPRQKLDGLLRGERELPLILILQQI